MKKNNEHDKVRIKVMVKSKMRGNENYLKIFRIIARKMNGNYRMLLILSLAFESIHSKVNSVFEKFAVSIVLFAAQILNSRTKRTKSKKWNILFAHGRNLFSKNK